MANEYTTRAELKASLSIVNETFADADIDRALEAASRGIDAACSSRTIKRRFYADADAAQVRYYRPISADLVMVDDIITLTSLATDPGGDGTYEETWTVNTDYTLEPDNAAADGRPYELIRRHPAGNYLLPDRKYPRSVKVTGKFGWTAVPPTIKQLTSILAARLLKRAKDSPYGFMLTADAAAQIARNDPDFKLLLGNFRRGGIPLA